MTTPDAWSTFLNRHASAAKASEWPGAPGASMDQLTDTEKHLAIQLPPSYRTFLQVSNGWTLASRSVPILLPIEKIQWFRKLHREWVEAYQLSEPVDLLEAEYFDYSNCDSVLFDSNHLQHSLCVSDIGDDAVLLLNPMVIWPDGEWETWFFANWLPGAQRFRSFADWFQHEHADLTAGSFAHGLKPGELPTVYRDPPSKPQRRIRPRETVHDFKSVLRNLRSDNPTTRRTAAKRMGRIRTPDSFETLCGLIKTEQDHYVRMEIIHSIGRAGGDTAVEFLRAWIEDEELGSEATHAIASMSSEIPTQISLQLLSIGHAFAPAVAHRLGQRCENRAIPHLVKLMIESNFAMHPFRPYWGSTIAVFGNMEAFKALQPLTADPDVQIRSSALNGMGLLAFSAKSAAIKSSARELLERALQNEVDSELRAAIQLSLDILPKPNG